jgi:hypothetical protein
MFVLFQVFWVVGWSVGVVILFLITILVLFYGESARISGGRLIHVPRLGPLKFVVEYDLAKIRNVRVERVGVDRARIRFDYRDRGHGLGNDMPLTDAEHAVQAIQEAVAAVGARQDSASPVADPGEPVAAIPRAFPAGQRRAPETPSTPSATLALVGANLIPLAGVLLLGWDLGAVMTLFWAENAVIGFYNLLKLAVVARWAVLVVGPFFLGHYGGFMAGHFATCSCRSGLRCWRS